MRFLRSWALFERPASRESLNASSHSFEALGETPRNKRSSSKESSPVTGNTVNSKGWRTRVPIVVQHDRECRKRVSVFPKIYVTWRRRIKASVDLRQHLQRIPPAGNRGLRCHGPRIMRQCWKSIFGVFREAGIAGKRNRSFNGASSLILLRKIRFPSGGIERISVARK